MNRFRCILFATLVALSSSTLASGGIMQTPGKTDPPPPPSELASTTESTTDGRTLSTDEIQIVLQDATTMLLKILLTIY